MNNKLKEFAKDSMFYAVGQWVSKLGGLLLVPILSRIFLPSEYGVIDLLTSSYAFLLMFISFNIDSGVQKYYFLSQEEEKKILLSSTGALRLIVTIACSVTIIFFSRQISILIFNKSIYSAEICLLAAALPFEDINSQLMLLLRLNRKAISFSVYNVLQVVIQPTLTYICVANLHLNLKGVFIAKLVSIIIMTLPLIIQQKKYYAKEIKIEEAIRILKFSLPGLPDGVLTTIINLLPRYFLLNYSTLTAVGLFGIADRVATTIDMFKVSFNRAWNPFAFAHAGKPDEKYIYEKIFKLFAASLLSIALVLAFFSREVLSILTSPQYHSAAPLVGGLSLYYAIRALTLVYGTGLYSANKVAYTSYMTLVQFTVFVFSALILVPRHGATGMIMSLNAAVIIYFACYALAVKRYFPFKFSFCRLLLLSLIAFALAYFVYNTSNATTDLISASFISQKIIIIISYILTSYYIILTCEERNGIENAIKAYCTKK